MTDRWGIATASQLDQKSFVEGARALTVWGAYLIDRAHKNGDADADGLISLLTPVIKGFQTDKGFEYATAAQQVYGGGPCLPWPDVGTYGQGRDGGIGKRCR